MAETEHLDLPLLESGQAQKHVTVNEALRLIDAVVQLAVETVAIVPPSTPVNGERHIVGDSASGAWSGHEGDIALRRDGAWTFIAPRAGFVAFNRASGRLLFFDDGWIDLFAEAALDHVARVGVGTAADATNRLAVRAPAVLHTAIYAADGGSGDAQLKLNKEAAGDSVSLLLQHDFSGRAEIGLTGDDDLHIKVSADGAAWVNGATISRSTGHWGVGSAAPDSHVAPALITGAVATTGDAMLAASAYWNAEAPLPFYLRRARGTPGSPSALLSGDRMFGIYAAGYQSGGAWGGSSVSIQAAAEENFTSSGQGTRLDFSTTAIGATVRRIVAQVRANGTLHLVPQSAAPASPENGQVYYDSTLGKFRGYAAGAWADLH